MFTLTFDDATKASQIFERIYDNLQQRAALFNFKLKRSPELVEIKSIRKYMDGLQKLSKDDLLCDLWNDFTCVELGDELRQSTLAKHNFIQHCRALLDGSHEIFHFSKPLSTQIGVDDLKLIKVVAEKLVDEITMWKSQAVEMTRSDFWQFDFCTAEIRCVIAKCQTVMELDSLVDSNVTVDQTLFHEWWDTIDKNRAIAVQLQQSH